jgi:Helix-turn-helix domain of resolvase
LANGRVLFSCETCGGRGFVEVVRSRDPYDTGRSLGYGSAGHESGRERDAEIARLGVQLAGPRPERDMPARPERWEVERLAKWRCFDYAAVDEALEALRGVDGLGYHVVMEVCVYGWVGAEALSVRAAAVLEVALGRLSAWLPDPLRAPDELVGRPERLSRAGRDGEIRRLVRDGMGAQWIAREFGISVSSVYRVAKGI